ncbi:MAG: hypothetical protein CUN55_19970, partial [Phototrophicales bacterium]
TMYVDAVDIAQTSINSGAGEVSAAFRPTKIQRPIHQTGSGAIVVNATCESDGTLELQGLSVTNLGSAANFESVMTSHQFSCSFMQQ